MSLQHSVQSDATDALDRQILHSLQLAPRASFRRIADVVGASEQTVARRHRRLSSTGIVRVVATMGPGQVVTSWMMRIQCRPSAVRAMAELLAAEDNVAWVSIVGGGSEVLCALRLRQQDDSHQLLLQRLPRTAEVLGMSAHALLHMFIRGGSADWTGYEDLLSEDQQATLLGGAGLEPDPESTAQSLAPDEIDQRLMNMLAVDGRATVKDLATHCSCTEARVSRRLDALIRTKWLRMEVEIATAMIGFTTNATLWLIVDPSHLTAAGEALATHPQVAFVAAVSGTANLMASVICRDPEALYHYISTDIANVPGVRQVETSLIVHNVKHERSREHRRRLQE